MMSNQIPEDILGFLANSFFFWKREADGQWCCISATAGPQDLTYNGFGDTALEKVMRHWPYKTEVFRKGDTLEFTL